MRTENIFLLVGFLMTCAKYGAYDGMIYGCIVVGLIGACNRNFKKKKKSN